MSYFDFALLAIIGGFSLFGLWFGLLHTIGSFIGTIFGLYFSMRYYEVAGDWLLGITGWGGNFTKVLMFIIIFILISRLIGLAFMLFEKLFGIITKLPFIRSLNHLAGAVFGIFEGAVIVGVSLYFIARFPVGDTFMNAMANSNVAPYLVKPVKLFMPLIPDAVKTLQSTVDTIF